MDESKLEQKILDHVNRANYRPVKPRVIVKQLRLSEDLTADAKRTIKRLVRRGRLAYAANHLITAADPSRPKGDRITGTFQRTKRGFGFVRLAGATDAEGKSEDIYIPAKRTSDAATGDIVEVRLMKGRDREPGPRGEIVAVLERETHQFVGTYFESDGGAYVQVDGTLFAQPIFVGDPGAKSARVDDKVVFEMVRFPSPLRPGEGVLVEVLGPAGKPGVDTLSIIREFNLPDGFAEDALEEARAQSDAFDATIPEGRVDLTGETVVTIDPADARDFDDAISLERLDNGHWRLGVHIADVSHFVRPNSALDREALDRATSVYLPDRVIPMLPEIISNSLASLQPNKVRYTKTALIELTAEGQRVATDLCSAAIKSDKRLTYEQVDSFLEDPGPWRRKLGAKVHDLLGRMHELAMMLRRRRKRNGSLELTMPEVKIELDQDGRVSGAHVAENTESHQVIEEFMLTANEAVAETLFAKETPFLRRIHPSPSPKKLKALTEFVTELGFKVGSLENRFELQKLLDQVAGRPEQHAVNFAALRSLPRAVYAPDEEGHYALASECYCHFTSPIRRYPDLTVHRLIEAIVEGRTPREHVDQLFALGRHCSDRERRAESAERELVKLKLLSYMSERIGHEMEAVVTGVESFGLFVQGIDLPAEGLIRTEVLLDDHYYFDRATHTLSGHRSGNTYRLGDRFRVVVARVDLERRELDFRLVASEPRRMATPKRSTQPKKKVVKTKKAAAKKGRKSPKKKAAKKRTKRQRKK
ncbi:MAG TPA: ribonuclease R [Thermoguttaceae bacterium]|nr:ribonuclease R [Thermoguttaceae bacterium]